MGIEHVFMTGLSKFTTFHTVLAYALIRIVSFLTWHHPHLNSVIALFLIVIFLSVSIKNLPLAWTILTTELILGGSGHFFEFLGLLVRTWFLAIFGIVWLLHRIREKNITIGITQGLLICMTIFAVFLCLSVIRGFLSGHSPLSVLQDTVLYIFLLLLFPALEFQKGIDAYSRTLVKGFIIGSTLFSFVTLVIYSSGLGALPDTYYHWFRNVAAGKITDLGNNFFRIVLPEHLLIVPAILIITSYLLKNPKNKTLWLLLQYTLFTLLLNFSRIYFVALAFGFLFLAFKQPLKRWMTVSLTVFVCMGTLFTAIHGTASRGTSFGWELVGIRAAGIAAPSDEVSGAIRMALLPDILETIKKHPWFGSGLGTPVTFIHPVTKLQETRTQFDWGYLEMIAELGILGVLSFFALFCLALYHLARFTYTSFDTYQEKELKRGLFAGAVSLCIINITTPSLFQGFGVLFFVFILLVLSEDHVSSESPLEQSHNV